MSRIIGPDKVWSQQFSEPPSNVNMNQTGWVPKSYQNFVQYGKAGVNYPYAQDGTQYSTTGNFDFWKNSISGPASTPYPIALRTAAMLNGFPADANGVYGFFTYPNDETAGQFTNIPTSVSLDIYVYGTGDGTSDDVIEGGTWIYSPPARRVAPGRTLSALKGTDATDTFILNRSYRSGGSAPALDAHVDQYDIVVIDKAALGASSSSVDVVDIANFGATANDRSQFVFETSTGKLYFDGDPCRVGYTGLLAQLPSGSVDPASRIFVL